VGSGWSVGESPVRSAQVPSVTGPWPWPWQRFASSARSSTPRLVQRGRSARPGHRPGCLCVEPCAMDASTAALAPSLTVVDRRPSPATVSLENLSPTRCFYAPCLLAPQRARRARPAEWPCCRHRRRRRRLSQRHITSAALDVSLSRPGRLTNIPAPT
jgi:hypothetical protein